MNEYESEPSAPNEDDIRFSFHQNLYTKILFPEFNINNYTINRIMNQYKFLDDER